MEFYFFKLVLLDCKKEVLQQIVIDHDILKQSDQAWLQLFYKLRCLLEHPENNLIIGLLLPKLFYIFIVREVQFFKTNLFRILEYLFLLKSPNL